MKKPAEEHGDGSGAMDDIGQLIKFVGAREAVPDERFERARRKVLGHWQTVFEEQRVEKHPRRYGVIAIAASVAVVVGMSFVIWNQFHVAPVDSLASVERVLGEVLVAGEVASSDSEIGADSSIVTDSDGRIALRMSGGQSLRVDSASHVILHSPGHVSLKAGALYIDTAFAIKENPILVSTPLGTAQDIGTQFQVRLLDEILLVGVREGLVEVTRPGGFGLSVNKGHFVELSDSSEQTERPLESGGPDWDWIETVVPEFDIDGATLERYLEWYAHERSLELEWANVASRTRAGATFLTGSIAGASLDEGLEIVQRISAFDYQLTGDTIRIRVE
jgi:hypothetical protein